ncbi:SMC-Scp complex subunit ScpB [Lysobacter humi (ex Lee et al. 2017)]
MDQTLVNRIVEAALLASSQPLTLAQLRELFPDDQPAPAGMLEAAIEHLREASAERGVELVEVASGFRFQVQADVHAWVARLWTDRQTRYTRATLETLALIAYRQPITRGEIEQVRGVSVSSNIIKALEEREWIRVVGHRDVPGRPALYGTTKTFLDYFGLKRLDELPPLSELKDIGELEPQLQFEEAAGVAPRIAVGLNAEAGDPGDVPHVGDSAANDDSDGTRDGVDRADDGDVSERDAASARTSDHEASADAGMAGHADAEAIEPTATRDALAEARDDDEASDDAVDTDEDQELDFRRERPVVFEDDTDQTSDENDSDDAPGDVDPEAAPGTRAATENDHEQDNAVETTTVPALTTASEDAAESDTDD